MKRSYIVAHFWDDDDSNAISAYTYGNEVQYGDEEQAENFLHYVKQKCPYYNWEIFWIPTSRDENEQTSQ